MERLNTAQSDAPEKKTAKRVILLDDLDGAEDEIVGGAGQKLFFGETTAPLPDFLPPGGLHPGK
jgi:hypothetical protein